MTMNSHEKTDPQLPLLQQADIEDKIILLRVDHNVVKKGRIEDPYRIDQTIGTIFNIVERGGRPILMTHVGRPRDKKSGKITISSATSVNPIVDYLERKLHTTICVPAFSPDSEYGIRHIDTSVNLAIKKLRRKEIGAIYLPNMRWFKGEESNSQEREKLARQLAGLADIFVNDAFGSWQPHVSTYDIVPHLPSFAGYLMQQEIENLYHVLNPERPFVAVVAGAKFDTKIKPLYKIHEKVDKLILGGLIYNTYLCAKYNVRIKGIPESDIVSAKTLVNLDKKHKKILDLPYVYESDTIEGRFEEKYRLRCVRDFEEGMNLNYILDIAQESFEDPVISEALDSARTIFVNAVMGYTPHFTEGSMALDRKIDKNTEAKKFYGGGDTLKEFKDLCPGLYLSVLEDSKYHFFTGGGTVLKAIELGTPYELAPVKALIENSRR
jgi:phosphoglycerate kinase